jgi:1,4-dihydroxy-2-naphthoate octaprenyltransferase
MGPVQIWVAASRPRTLPAAIAPVLVGSALAWHDRSFEAAAAGLCLAFALLVQIGTNFANDYYDFIKGADTAARVGPRRAVAAGLIAPGTMKTAMIGVFATAFATGLGLIFWGGPWLLAVGVASIACGFLYTGGPWPLAYHGLGDLFVFIFFGLVAVTITYFVQAGSVTVDAFLAAAAIGVLAANILVVNNYRDVETDAAAGKRTLVVRWGRAAARLQFALAHVVAFAVPLILWARGQRLWILLPLALVPWAIGQMKKLRRSTAPQELIRLLGETGRYEAAYGVLLAIGLIV